MSRSLTALVVGAAMACLMPHVRLEERRATGLTLPDQPTLQERLEARRGLPEIRFHDRQHTCASLLLSKNVNPKIVFKMPNHATIAITLNTYSHVLPNMHNQAAAAMEEILS